MTDSEPFTAPGQPGPAAWYGITVATDAGGVVCIAGQGWDVLAKLRKAMTGGNRRFEQKPVTPAEARPVDPGPS